MFTSTGILFNHESPRRGFEFVTRKITHAVAKIKLNLQKKLILGNINSKRDWGYAGDYVEGMWKILQHDVPEDFVLSSGKMYSVREFVDLAFKHVNIDIEYQSRSGNIEYSLKNAKDEYKKYKKETRKATRNEGR